MISKYWLLVKWSQYVLMPQGVRIRYHKHGSMQPNSGKILKKINKKNKS